MSRHPKTPIVPCPTGTHSALELLSASALVLEGFTLGSSNMVSTGLRSLNDLTIRMIVETGAQDSRIWTDKEFVSLLLSITKIYQLRAQRPNNWRRRVQEEVKLLTQKAQDYHTFLQGAIEWI